MLMMVLVFAIVIVLYFIANDWVDGVYGGVDAVILSLVLVGFILFSYFLSVHYSFLLGSLPAAGVVAFIHLRNRSVGAKAVYRKNIEKYRAMIARDPKNNIFREMLADVLYELGESNQAIEELTTAVQMGASASSKLKLDKWVLRKKCQENGTPLCRWCDTENEQGDVLCKNCGFELPYDTLATRKLFAGNNAKRVLYAILGSATLVTMAAIVMGLSQYIYIPILSGVFAYWGWHTIKNTRT